MRIRSAVPITVLAGCALAAGCADGPPRATTADLARAQALVTAAEGVGSQRYAAADLQEARDKLQQANQLAGQGKAKQADELADEAAIDAQLASARAQDGMAQHDLAAVDQSLSTLRNEEDRHSSGSQLPQEPSPSTNSPE